MVPPRTRARDKELKEFKEFKEIKEGGAYCEKNCHRKLRPLPMHYPPPQPLLKILKLLKLLKLLILK